MAITTKAKRRKARLIPRPDVVRAKRIPAPRYPYLLDAALATGAAIGFVVAFIA